MNPQKTGSAKDTLMERHIIADFLTNTKYQLDHFGAIACTIVIPAQAEIHALERAVDSRLRGNDGNLADCMRCPGEYIHVSSAFKPLDFSS